MSTLCLHSGAVRIPREELIGIPIPKATNSYCPVAHHELIDTIERQAIVAGHKIDLVEIGIQDAKREDEIIQGAKMFSVMRLHTDGPVGSDNLRLDIGIRNSYDKSIAVGLVAGSSVFVCDNMSITGEIQAVRKHTPNVWDDIIPMVTAVLMVANKQHILDQEMRDEFKASDIGFDSGLDLLGIMAAHGFISYTGGSNSIFATAIKEWSEPSFEEFADRNIWSLYNACTFATKKSTLVNTLVDNAKVTKFFRDKFAPGISSAGKELNDELNKIRMVLS